jgi:hypothetical protein
MLEEEILRKPDLAQDKLLARMRKVGFRTPPHPLAWCCRSSAGFNIMLQITWT